MKALKNHNIKLWDIVIIIFVLLAAALSLLFFKAGGDTVVVTYKGVEIYRGPLDRDTVFSTPDEKNIIAVKDGRAYMQSADCPDSTCVESGAASPHRPVVCLPNEVVIYITGDSALDSITS